MNKRDKMTSGFGLSAVFALAMAGGWAGPVSAQTMDAALARAYSANPTLNAQRASVRATDENVPQAKAGYRPRITASTNGESDKRSSASMVMRLPHK